MWVCSATSKQTRLHFIEYRTFSKQTILFLHLFAIAIKSKFTSLCHLNRSNRTLFRKRCHGKLVSIQSHQSFANRRIVYRYLSLFIAFRLFKLLFSHSFFWWKRLHWLKNESARQHHQWLMPAALRKRFETLHQKGVGYQ